MVGAQLSGIIVYCVYIQHWDMYVTTCSEWVSTGIAQLSWEGSLRRHLPEL